MRMMNNTLKHKKVDILSKQQLKKKIEISAVLKKCTN